jgi:hypothetical protein
VAPRLHEQVAEVHALVRAGRRDRREVGDDDVRVGRHHRRLGRRVGALGADEAVGHARQSPAAVRCPARPPSRAPAARR